MENDLQFSDTDAVFMAEEDAIKCQCLANETLWILPVEAYVEDEFREALIKKISEKCVPETS